VSDKKINAHLHVGVEHVLKLLRVHLGHTGHQIQQETTDRGVSWNLPSLKQRGTQKLQINLG